MNGFKIFIIGILVALGSTALIMGALWQLEIIMIDVQNEWPYVLPFEIFESYDYEKWRDFWYIMIAIAYATPWILILALLIQRRRKFP